MKKIFKKIALSLSLLLSMSSLTAFAYSNNNPESKLVEDQTLNINRNSLIDSVSMNTITPYAIDGVIPPGGSKVFVGSYKMGFSRFDRASVLAIIAVGVHQACTIFESKTGRKYKNAPSLIVGLGAFVNTFISEKPSSPTRWAKVYYTTTTTVNGTLADRYLVELYKDSRYSQYAGCEWYYMYRAS